MPFVLQNWSQDSTSANIYAPVSHNYISTTDSIATVSGANYFATVAIACSVGDYIYAVCTDGVAQLQVSAVQNDTAPFTISTAAISSGGTSVLATATGTLTQAQWNLMFTTPVQLVAAQGTGNGIFVEQLVLNYRFATAAFTGGGLIVAQYGNTAAGAGPAACATLTNVGFTDQVASRIATLPAGTASIAAASVSNAAVFISNQTAVFSGGNASASVTWRMFYRVLPVLT